jgi:cytochrome P450
MIEQRRNTPQDDLLTRLIHAEVDREDLSQREILGFLSTLIVAGPESITNPIDNTVLCLLEHPDQLARLRPAPQLLLPAAMEEVLRYSSPLQWITCTPQRDVEVHGQIIPAGRLVLPDDPLGEPRPK